MRNELVGGIRGKGINVAVYKPAKKEELELAEPRMHSI